MACELLKQIKPKERVLGTVPCGQWARSADKATWRLRLASEWKGESWGVNPKLVGSDTIKSAMNWVGEHGCPLQNCSLAGEKKSPHSGVTEFCVDCGNVRVVEEL